MKTFNTKTGLGYVREIATGKIMCRCDLPSGDHFINDGYEFVQVNTRAELAAVVIDKEPENSEAVKEAADRSAIANKIEQIAIEQLRKDGYQFKTDKYK